MQLMSLLRKHAQDETKFGDYLRALDFAVEKQRPLPSLSNKVLEKNLLTQCLAETRQLCSFPIRPETTPRTSKTLFEEKLSKWMSSEEREPSVVDFVLLYMRGQNGVFTIAKAWSTN